MSVIHPHFDIPGVDVSHWQGVIDWKRLSQYATFAIIRIGDGIAGGTLDRKWLDNWNGARGKVQRGAYWFYRTSVTPQDQARWVIDAYQRVAGDYGEIGFYVDLEKNDARLNPQAHASHLSKFLSLIDTHLSGHSHTMAGIYTSAGYWNNNINPSGVSDLDIRPLWVAQWPRNVSPGPGSLPRGWERWDIWQFSAQGDGRELLGPGGSRSLDLDVFNGSAEHFAWRFGLEGLPPPPTDDRIIIGFRPVRAGMNIRNKPSEIGSAILAKTTAEVLPVIGRASDERGRTWYKLAGNDAYEMWISSTTGQPVYQ